MKRWGDAAALGLIYFLMFIIISGTIVLFSVSLYIHTEAIPWFVGALLLWGGFTVLAKIGVIR